MNHYLIPANSKKGKLIFNVFRPIDLIIVLVGGFITLIMLFAISNSSLLGLFLKLFPIGVSLFLVLPVPHYHNVLVFIIELYTYYTRPSKYYWRGWCCTYVDTNAEQTKN